ncbi:SH3 domain-containing protein [Pseudobacillus wudalianchiensis]|uniref:SH3b domain-containing protein n=1 Tax=Pseudobacillus wudalianchiensis TaxID=1743143 RepID=A0A1B9B7C9_9BACI|nr:SH3 domain-containing protein [Bacillus wudalianchiensis]OCA92004.1 hypothetical protein A8F95_19060 [Bacillus wudalianchiensis]
MKKIFLLMVVFFLSITLFSAKPTAASTGNHTVKVKTTLNVREKPSPRAKIVGSLKNGTIVYVYSTEPGGWSKIKYKNKAGYVASRYLKAITPTSPSTKKWNGKWQTEFGKLLITHETASSFKFDIHVVMGEHVGDLQGTAKIKDGKATYSGYTKSSFSKDPYCRITFTHQGKSIRVKESSACLYWHGATATFDGTYFK